MKLDWMYSVMQFFMKRKKLVIPIIKNKNELKANDLPKKINKQTFKPGISKKSRFSEITKYPDKKKEVNRNKESKIIVIPPSQQFPEIELDNSPNQHISPDISKNSPGESTLEEVLSRREDISILDEKDGVEKTKVLSPADASVAITPKSFSNYRNTSQESKWFVVCASAIGKSHLKNNLPCQDNHYWESINKDCGIAICCDGAGSAKNSHIGSGHVAKKVGTKFFKRLLTRKEWFLNYSLPTEEEWAFVVYEGFKQIYNSLEDLAISKQVTLESLSCTISVIIYSPIGLLVGHIGDGRAAFCNKDGEWKSLITPHKGEEANQTVFITSNWKDNFDLVMSGVPVPESRVIAEKPIAFTMMSDGCESHSFQCSTLEEKTQKWHDPNLPYPKFFNPLTTNLKSMFENKVSIEEANIKWRKFIEEGTPGLEGESDDKTMILAILN